MSDRICPIMSRPSQGNSVKLYSSDPLFESEEEMKKYGWTPIDGKPFGDVVMCQKEKCMAWTITTKLTCSQPSCPAKIGSFDCRHYPSKSDQKDCPSLLPPVVSGFCKLIERQP
jgi:hypothetical protein